VFEYQQLFHVGIRVAGIDAAMDELGPSMGVHWAKPQQRVQHVWLPGSGMTDLPLRFVYSVEGPQHVELLEGPEGSIWDGRSAPGVHHQGIWADDIAAVTEAFVAAGWALELAQLPPGEGYGAFTYVRSQSGVLIEPVWSGLRPMFERWWAGGDLA